MRQLARVAAVAAELSARPAAVVARAAGVARRVSGLPPLAHRVCPARPVPHVAYHPCRTTTRAPLILSGKKVSDGQSLAFGAPASQKYTGTMNNNIESFISHPLLKLPHCRLFRISEIAEKTASTRATEGPQLERKG